MKTQFTDILKIEKNRLQTLERELKFNQAEIERLNFEIAQKEAEILQIEYPISGNFSIYQQYNISMHNMKQNIEDLKNKKLLVNDQIGRLRQKMIEVNKSIEKYKYLENQVLEAHRLELKRLEEKNLDEIAVMLYKSQHQEID